MRVSASGIGGRTTVVPHASYVTMNPRLVCDDVCKTEQTDGGNTVTIVQRVRANARRVDQ